MSNFDDVIRHEGVGHDEDPPGRGSGRYAWGSGENPYQHQFNFISEVRRLRKNNLKDAEIAKMLLGDHATTTDLKIEIGIEEKRQRQLKSAEAFKYLDKFNGNALQASKAMGIPASSFYKLVNPLLNERTDRYEKTAEILKNRIDKLNQPIDISKGTEHILGVTRDTLMRSAALLEREGYIKGIAQVPQSSGNKTTLTLLCPPGTDVNERADYQGNIKKWVNWRNTGIGTVEEFSPDKGKTFWIPKYPTSMDSSRVYVRYKEDGGIDKDGLIEIRKGVPDLSLGKSNYAQLRVMVDGDHYMKGMAVYSDDIPEGYDVVYNTKKGVGTAFTKVLKGAKVSIPIETVAKKTGMSREEVAKKMHEGVLVVDTVDDLVKLGYTRDQARKFIDKDNPFGASIKAGGQTMYTDANGKNQLSPINKLIEEGEWDSWSKNLSAQFLSKQPLKLINQQLNLSVDIKRMELDQIKSLTNPAIKQKMLEEFARGCDANAADLSAKGFKNQAFQVLLPVNSLKENECYAPRYKDGDQLALVRYPHAGPFEIPKVTVVNSRRKDLKNLLGDGTDAIAINPKTAAILSGADFDGDTALVIPLRSNKLTLLTQKPLAILKDFDTLQYKVDTDKKTISSKMKQRQMGETTNLIADMTLQGAPLNQIAKVVKHSMVIIDSEKHNLDWKRSQKENDIIALKKEWQGENANGTPKGASTILTKAKGDKYIPHRREVNDRKKMTPAQRKAFDRGEIIYEDTGKMQYNYKKGKAEEKLIKVHGMDAVTNAMELVRNPKDTKEVAYANYANTLKGLANEARKESRSIKPTPVSQEAKRTYSEEVSTLNEKLKNALKNAPKERKAREMATMMCSEKFKNNPEMDYEHRQREKDRALNQARAMVGAKKDKVEITDREWEAIQANAISFSKLKEILNNTDSDKFKERATPRKNTNSISSNELRVAKNMYNTGMYTMADIAEALGISVSTVSKAIKGA